MHDQAFRHFVAILITLTFVFMFIGGYTAGKNEWPWVALVFLPFYALVVHLIRK